MNEGSQQPKIVGGNDDPHARFLETARALGCDEDEAAFDEKLKGIVRQETKKGQGTTEDS
jgi:hypothetical protein